MTDWDSDMSASCTVGPILVMSHCIIRYSAISTCQSNASSEIVKCCRCNHHWSNVATTNTFTSMRVCMLI